MRKNGSEARQLMLSIAAKADFHPPVAAAVREEICKLLGRLMLQHMRAASPTQGGGHER